MNAPRHDPLGWLAMLACIVIAAHGEWSLAVQAGYQPYVAAALPVAVDAYAIRSMQAGREVLAPVLLMVATNAAAHLVHAELLHVGPALVVAVSAIAPVVLWRVHALRREHDQEHEAAPADERPEPLWAAPEPPEPEPEPQPEPALVLGPFTPLAQLHPAPTAEPAGTGPEQAGRGADERTEPEAEPTAPQAEPEPGPEGPGGQFGEDVKTARRWLADDPTLTGTAIGTKLGKSDSYGRRVRREAHALALAGAST
ncbi:hypothetical protein [Streptomyces sp. NPDC088923]|uniref:hypothetical protein n=1 Tax=Streptomyces sp. NPDC088923 TaxID=3365913 RepID=UPI0037F9CF85